MNGYTKQQASACLQRFFRAHCPRQYLVGTVEGLTMDFFEYGSPVHVRWEVALGVEASLFFGLDAEVEVTWSSAGRDVVRAQAALGLYQMVVNFAAALESKRREEQRYLREAEREAERAALKKGS